MALERLALIGALLLVIACGDDDGDPPSPARPGTTDAADAPSQDAGAAPDLGPLQCPEVPTAYLFDHADGWTGVQGAAQLLTTAGFDVRPLPLDRDPSALQGLIFFASFASESAEYRGYVKTHAANLYKFVDKANVLVQMAQADQTEAVPPFLPSTHEARRHDLDLTRLYALNPEHPLLAGIELQDRHLAWSGELMGWETFVSQGGFEVVLAEEGTAKNAALMEGAYGQGRIVLAAMAFDKPLGTGPKNVPFSRPTGQPAARDAFNRAFFANLHQHVKNVCRRQTKALQITPPTRPVEMGDTSFVLAVLPDTQVYSLLLPGIFSAQTGWIAANARARNIPYVLHLGDIVNNNSADEWRRATQAMSLLDGIVPYALVPGNHDYGPSGDASTRDTLMNDHFKFDQTAAWPSFGGAFEPGKLDNTYHLFTAGGRDFIVIALEWGPRDQVVAWADDVMNRHPDRQGILVTHAYLNWNDRRYDWRDDKNPQDFNPHHYATPGPMNDGEELWQKLVRKHRFVLVLGGHVLADGTGYLASVTDRGNTCHQILSNYQFRNLGGEGYLRLMEFSKDNKTVRVRTYSPLYDSFLVEADQNFSFTLDLPPQRPQ